MPKVTLLNRYNFAVLALFVVITLIASSIAVYRYNIELEQQLEKEGIALAEQAKIIHRSLEKSEQTLNGLKQFAQYYLSNPDNFFTSPPHLIQEGDSFFLKTNALNRTRQTKRLQSMITGQGDINHFDEAMWHELTMANALTPAYITSSQTNTEATWFYYISLNRFINIYPWINHHSWQYSDQMLNESYLWQIKQGNLQGVPFVWSYSYQASVNKGLKASIGTGVFYESEFKGALVIDIDLAGLQQKLPQINKVDHGYVLINEQGIAVAHVTNEPLKLAINAKWQDFTPLGLNELSQEQLLNFNDNYHYQQWILQKQKIKINGWSLIKYQPYSDFSQAPKNHFIFSVATFIVGLVAFLSLVYWLTRKTFIKPASEFIHHIEHCAKGDPGKITPTKEWVPWFQLVENIFGQNRSLLHQLKEQNVVLDNRVAEKTQALIEYSEQSYRAYVLLRSVINAIPEFIIFNDNEGNLTGCNRAFEQFIGESEKMLLGHSITNLLPKSIQKTLIEFSNLDEEQATLGYQATVETSGSIYEIFCTLFHNEAKAAFGTIIILRDISVQFSAQETLKQAKDQAVFANKAKSQFLANMSHEIRTPINAIQGMMTLMEKTDLSVFQQQYLVNAKNSSTALLHLIDELLDLSKIEAGKFRLNNVNAKLDSIVNRALQLNMLSLHQKGLKLIIDIDANAPEFFVIDEIRLTQVLTNLLNNAIKFTHQGVITLSIKVEDENANNTLLRFAITDTGIGIEHDKMATLFVAFHQVDESMTREYGGSGLGLAISQEIVELMGSNINIHSIFGEGSEFSFLLPIQVEQQETIKQCGQINIVTLGCDISSSLVDAIERYGWCHHGVEDITALHELSVKRAVVLLVDNHYLSMHEQIQLHTLEKQFEQIILIGICQPIMTEISVNVRHQLNQLLIPYLCFETPLYRFTLSQIEQYLRLAPQPHEINNVLAQKQNSSLKPISTIPISPLAGSLQHISVLLVEDNLVNQMVAQELLVSMGAQVTIAENGQIAIECIIKQRPDIVLMDIQMPVMDGLTASKKIRMMDIYKDLPIIAMTAHARQEDKNASKEAGMNLHISKPVNADTLSRSIINLMI